LVILVLGHPWSHPVGVTKDMTKILRLLCRPPCTEGGRGSESLGLLAVDRRGANFSRAKLIGIWRGHEQEA